MKSDFFTKRDYEKLWNAWGQALMLFVQNFATRSYANRRRIYAIVENKISPSEEDVLADCWVKLISVVDSILSKPTAEAMAWYSYKTVNNFLKDMCKRINPNYSTVSLQDLLGESGEYCYEDVLSSRAPSPQEIIEMQEEVKVVTLDRYNKLNRHPSQLICYLACVCLKYKPRELAAMIVENGWETTCEEMLDDMACETHLPVSIFREIISNPKLSSKSFHADTNNRKAIGLQISRLSNRAKNHLEAENYPENEKTK